MLSNDFFFPFEIGLIVFALCIGLAIIASGRAAQVARLGAWS